MNSSTVFNILDRITALILLILFLPFLIIFYMLVKVSSTGPFIFTQKRIGKNKEIFIIYKIRTMIVNADKLKDKYRKMNQYKEPIFKINNDPRYTKIGKYLANTGLDEIPQLINIILGDMTFIGPRPLPVNEAERLPPKYDARYSVLPGIAPPWIISDAHALTSNLWLDLELEYIRNRSSTYNIKLIFKSIKWILNQLIDHTFK